MIYINFLELQSLMLQVKIQIPRPSGFEKDDLLKVFAIYHLGHLTWIIYINIHFPFARKLQMKFELDRPSSFK